MAVVINGSGTVTGISVGGLPDGVVDSGTLATNSVDSAELIDGAVDNSHMAAMAASKLTGALPAISGASLTGISGSVKNIYTGYSSGSAITVSSTSTPTSIGNSQNISITAGNTLMVWWQCGVYGSTAAHFSGGLYLNSSRLTGSATWGTGIFFGTTPTLTGWHNCYGQSIHTIASTGTYALELKFNCNSGSVQFMKDSNQDSGRGYDGSQVVAFEIEA